MESNSALRARIFFGAGNKALLRVVSDIFGKNREDKLDVATRAEDLNTFFPSLDKGLKQ